MYYDTDGVACTFPPGVTAEDALGKQADGGWINEDGAFGCVKSEWPSDKYGWARAFYALLPKLYRLQRCPGARTLPARDDRGGFGVRAAPTALRGFLVRVWRRRRVGSHGGAADEALQLEKPLAA